MQNEARLAPLWDDQADVGAVSPAGLQSSQLNRDIPGQRPQGRGRA
jgi:hypothetical protein